MNFKMPDKPKTTKAQVDALWDVVSNCVLTQLRVQNLKLTFVLVFLGILLGFVGQLLFRLF